MSIILLLLGSAVVYFFAHRQHKKNRLEIIEKNKKVSSPWQQRWNWFSGMIWPGYLYTLATGLWVNNFFFNP